MGRSILQGVPAFFKSESIRPVASITAIPCARMCACLTNSGPYFRIERAVLRDGAVIIKSQKPELHELAFRARQGVLPSP
jgi:hypothetical protein